MLTLSLFCVIWGRWQVLIYLFREERTDNRALTMDVTGRNIPPVTSSTVWLFVEAVNTHKLPPWWDTEYQTGIDGRGCRLGGGPTLPAAAGDGGQKHGALRQRLNRGDTWPEAY